jgi:hypothetical protein
MWRIWTSSTAWVWTTNRSARTCAIDYLWFDIAALFACFAAAGHPPPLAPVVLAYQIGYLSNSIPVPGGIGVLDGS